MSPNHATHRQKAREDFEHEAVAAWADYKATGLHLTGEEVNAWLSRWGADDCPEPPECHR